MPAKAHRTTSGMTRTHSRTSSNGSSKVNLGLQLTQKDLLPPRFPDKQTKRNAHIHHETGSRNTSPFPRNNSSIRVQSKEQIQPAVLRRAPTPTPLGNTNKASTSKHKVGFSISSPSEVDDDEWVSSESGAATPLQETDSDHVTTPVEPVKPAIPRTTSHVNGFGIGNDVPTPRARSPPLPRVETIRPAECSAAPLKQVFQAIQSSRPPEVPAQHGTPWGTQPQLPQTPTPVPKARSETHSPPRRSPDHIIKRQSMTRPPSTHSIASRTDSVGLRPHPLIRAHSYGQGVLGLAKPAPLAPLTTVLDDAVPAQMSTTSSPTSLRAVSPVMSMKTPSASPILSQASPSVSEAHRQLRRTSTSSARSIATLPVTSSSSQHQLNRTNHDRQRTISTSSTFAALSSLAMRSTPSPTRTPLQQFTVTFPPADKDGHSESAHPLLPPPYLAAHLTMLEYRNPLAESYDRVIRAKQAL